MIDREKLVARHRVVLTEPSPDNVVTVGNGDFAYSADLTGMQTFTAFHDAGAALARARQSAVADPAAIGAMLMATPTVNTATMSNWGWHEMPNPDGYVLDDAMTEYETPRGKVSYPDRYPISATMGDVPDEFKPGAWFAENPQRLDLGRVGLVLRGSPAGEPETDPSCLAEAHQTLDLWSGLVESTFRYGGESVTVQTVADPESDIVAFRVTSSLLLDGRIRLRLAFPYASRSFFDPSDWNEPDRHTSVLATTDEGAATIYRQLDETRYVVQLAFSSGDIRSTGQHQFELSTDQDSIELVVQFAPNARNLRVHACFDDVVEGSAAGWERFWTSGAAIELAGPEPRARELERRIVLSQYLTRVNCAGTLPPQETGLVTNSWQGKLHLEMHFWHAAHFAAWGRPELLERSLPWYLTILPLAQKTARRQSYPGARWPKQVGPEGRESPSEIGSLLIWQQPHLLYLLELVWAASSDEHRAQLLSTYANAVRETAVFMAAFVFSVDDVSHLGPPVLPAQEFYSARGTADPTFELAYWWWGLEIAQRWNERSGEPRVVEWDEVQATLARPHKTDGRYDAIATEPYLKRDDHPALLAALGMVPPTPLISAPVMANTLRDVQENWEWDSAWGWDFPVMAMTAARLGDGEAALEALMRVAVKNRFSAVGHSPQISSMLPIYLPSNGSLLAAISLIAVAGPGGSSLFPPEWGATTEGFMDWPS